MVATNDKDEDVIPPFQLSLQLSTHKDQVATVALLYFGANQNIISYDLWDALQQLELSSSTVFFQSFFKSTTTSRGKCYLKLCIGDQSMHTTFHVSQKGQASACMILG